MNKMFRRQRFFTTSQEGFPKGLSQIRTDSKIDDRIQNDRECGEEVRKAKHVRRHWVLVGIDLFPRVAHL